MKNKSIKIALGILVIIIAGSFILNNHLEAEGLRMCFGFPCSEIIEACAEGEYSHAFQNYSYCDYNICISHWEVHCYDGDCADCTEREKEYRRWASCEQFNSSCSSGGFF